METLAFSKRQSWLSWFFRGTLILGFLILAGRLSELQIIKGNYFRSLSEGNRIRRVPIVAARGKILARGGEILVGNQEAKKRIIFNKDSGFGKVEDLQGAKEDEIITEYVREYPLGEKFAHLSGYLGEVNPEEVGKINPECPEKGPRKGGTLVGRSGLEEGYECLLAGIDGEELVEVDTAGRKIRTLGKRDPIPGSNLKTSIDLGLQEKVSEVMQGIKGAAIVVEPTGRVLALYSSPSFDPNLFVNSQNNEKILQVLTDENLPLFNRAIGGQFHPGSVFKPLVAIAALEEGRVDENYIFEDKGVITIKTLYGDFSYSNWYFNQYGATEGKINIVRAIARSTDTFFYTLGELVGINKLVEWEKKFGLGEGTGIDIPGEIGGLVPSPEWKEKVKGEPWFLGNTYHVSIGQGDLSLTPVEVTRITSTIASGGKLCSFKIAEEADCQELKIEEANLSLVKEGMVEACRPGGTGYTFFDWNKESGPSTGRSGQVACKTGTAETNEDGKTHAWFTVFAPSDFPEIVATVLVERGGEGSRVAGPIAREIFDYWFSK